MTAFFVRVFKRENQCSWCKKDKETGYSLCAEHLATAREAFGRWSIRRRREHLCISCDRKGFRGFLRCRKHTIENRLRCAEWVRLHPDHTREQWEKQKAMRDSGRCPSCREHRPLPVGFKRCDICRVRHNQPNGLGRGGGARAWKWIG